MPFPTYPQNFRKIHLTHRQTNRQKNRQKHNLLGGGKKYSTVANVAVTMGGSFCFWDCSWCRSLGYTASL